MTAPAKNRTVYDCGDVIVTVRPHEDLDDKYRRGTAWWRKALPWNNVPHFSVHVHTPRGNYDCRLAMPVASHERTQAVIDAAAYQGLLQAGEYLCEGCWPTDGTSTKVYDLDRRIVRPVGGQFDGVHNGYANGTENKGSSSLSTRKGRKMRSH